MIEQARDDERVLFWAPRLLGLLFAVFVSIFALDAFGEDRPLGQMLFTFVTHLVPAAVVAGVVLVAWRWSLIGFFGFSALAAFYMINAWGRFATPVYAVMAGPMVLTSVLFLLDWASTHRHVQPAVRG
jgi:hypothetical protein